MVYRNANVLPVSLLNESNNPNSPPAPPLPSPPQPPPSSQSRKHLPSLDDYSTRLSSTSANKAKWFELVFAISFAAAIAHVSVTYEKVEGVRVPTYFNSNSTIFHSFVILDAFAFTASVIGILLRGIHERIDDYLSVFATTTLMAALSIYMSVLLPSFLKYIPYVLMFINLSVLLSLRLRNHQQKYIQ